MEGTPSGKTLCFFSFCEEKGWPLVVTPRSHQQPSFYTLHFFLPCFLLTLICLRVDWPSVLFSPFFSFLQSILNVISELQEQMCRLQLDIHRQIQERLLLSRDNSEEAAAGDSAAEPQPCSQDCAPQEGSPVGSTLKYIRACVCVGPFLGGGIGVLPNQNRVWCFSMDLWPTVRAWTHPFWDVRWTLGPLLNRVWVRPSAMQDLPPLGPGMRYVRCSEWWAVMQRKPQYSPSQLWDADTHSFAWMVDKIHFYFISSVFYVRNHHNIKHMKSVPLI